MALITIQVNKETIQSGNAQLLLCEARDYLESEEEIETELKNNRKSLVVA